MRQFTPYSLTQKMGKPLVDHHINKTYMWVLRKIVVQKIYVAFTTGKFLADIFPNKRAMALYISVRQCLWWILVENWYLCRYGPLNDHSLSRGRLEAMWPLDILGYQIILSYMSWNHLKSHHLMKFRTGHLHHRHPLIETMSPWSAQLLPPQ